ncbi:MAG: PIG-L family deacetylase, partial [Gemmatimonadaceae bacterium]
VGVGGGVLSAALLLLAPHGVASQERGAIALGQAVRGLGVNTRVLMIGAHPDDEDTNLIAWLSRGRHVTTGYLSLTRGDGGQNVIGNELGEALGVIRAEELLAARQVDGALQYFTRAYDFGFTKDTADTFGHWQRDSILGDVVRVVRAFRPHVIVSVFSGTTRDGHGQHQVSGMLAREAYDVAGDTARFSTRTHGAPWAAHKFYRAARGNAQAGTLGMNVGEYSPLLGESFGEIAGRSRSQHKSQAFGALERKGPIMNYVRREATRVNESLPAESEGSLFDGIDTTWARFNAGIRDPRRRAALDSLPAAFAAVRSAFDPFAPERLLAPLARASSLLGWICPAMLGMPCTDARDRDPAMEGDLSASIVNAHWRVLGAIELASGISIEATAPRETFAIGARIPVTVSIYNRGRDTVTIGGPLTRATDRLPSGRMVPPGGVLRDSLDVTLDSLTQPWWLTGRRGGMFLSPGRGLPASRLEPEPSVAYLVSPDRVTMTTISAPVMFRFADDVRGEIQRQVVAVPAVAVALDQEVQYAPAQVEVDREVPVHLRSADLETRAVRVTLSLPRGLTADSASRTVSLAGYDARHTVTFRVRGRIAAGEHRIAALAESNGERFDAGSDLIDYDHIRRQRVYRPATTTITAVDVRVPATLRVAYVPGVSDNVAPMLAQLGVSVTVIPAAGIARADLSPFTTVVIGPRAYDANPELVNANPRLFDFARAGGTLVVQYGQYEMTRPGYTPYPITMARPHNRVTHEDAPVTLLDGDAAVLRAPNRITRADFAGWVQERSLYMPRTFDERYRPVLEMSDPGEQPHRGAVLVAPLGRGTYVYTSLAFFRQLPAGVPGAARLFVNLLGAGQPVGGNAP